MTSGTLKIVDKSQAMLSRQDSSPRQTRITVYHQHIHSCACCMMDPSSLNVIGYDKHFHLFNPSIHSSSITDSPALSGREGAGGRRVCVNA